MEIGNKIKKVRELRNFTQQYMAEKLEMTTAGYSKIERDEVSVTFDKLEKISQILNIKLSNLIDFNENAFFQNATFHGNYNGIINHGEININEFLFEKLKDIDARLKNIEDKQIEKAP